MTAAKLERHLLEEDKKASEILWTCNGTTATSVA
jgi:hypothetical protein